MSDLTQTEPISPDNRSRENNQYGVIDLVKSYSATIDILEYGKKKQHKISRSVKEAASFLEAIEIKPWGYTEAEATAIATKHTKLLSLLQNDMDNPRLIPLDSLISRKKSALKNALEQVDPIQGMFSLSRQSEKKDNLKKSSLHYKNLLSGVEEFFETLKEEHITCRTNKAGLFRKPDASAAEPTVSPERPDIDSSGAATADQEQIRVNIYAIEALGKALDAYQEQVNQFEPFSNYIQTVNTYIQEDEVRQSLNEGASIQHDTSSAKDAIDVDFSTILTALIEITGVEVRSPQYKLLRNHLDKKRAAVDSLLKKPDPDKTHSLLEFLLAKDNMPESTMQFYEDTLRSIKRFFEITRHSFRTPLDSQLAGLYDETDHPDRFQDLSDPV
jgi:hypothetical protein